jgi:ribokinase
MEAGLEKTDIVGLGYCGWDYLCIVPRIPIDDKVEVVKSIVQGGGPAATAIYTAVKLGASALFIGTVGNDNDGEQIISAFKSVDVNTDEIKVRDEGCSPVAFCWTEESSGKRSIAWTRGSAEPLSEDEIDENVIRNAGLLHLDGHQTKAAVYAAEIAREAGMVVMIDAGTIVPDIEKLINMCDIIIASEVFSKRFTGEEDPLKATKKLFGENTKFAGITLGDKGCVGFDGNEFYTQKPFKVDVVDTTGAGDVFHGAFAYRYIKGGSWQECMEFSSAVSALKCTKFGGRTGIPTLPEVEEFLKKNKC